MQEKAKKVVGASLILIGVWTAIISLPSIFVSILLLTLIGGSGVLICYKLENSRDVFHKVSVCLEITACAYAIYTILYGYDFYAFGKWYRSQNELKLFIDSSKTIVPTAVLGTLVFAWLGRKKLSPDHKTLTAFKILAPFTLLLITPFIIGGLHDYNRRFDTNLSQVIQLKVVAKGIDEYWDDYFTHDYWVRGETLDGSLRYSSCVSTGFYDRHGIGALFEVRVHKGALGYEWVECIYE